MDSPTSNKKMHPWLHFLVELLSIRAGFHIKQSAHVQPKDKQRG